MNEKGRIIFYGIAGAYLVYLAYDMFQTRATAQDIKLLIFGVIFGMAGAVLLFMAGKSYKRYMSQAMSDEAGVTEEKDKTTEAIEEKEE